MRALCWHGKGDVRVDTVPDPKIEHPRDAIIRITACAICGSDLHLMDGYQPTMEKGDILGHENMGEVIELEVTLLRGHRVGGGNVENRRLRGGDRRRTETHKDREDEYSAHRGASVSIHASRPPVLDRADPV